MRVHISTDLDEFGPDLATVEILWDLPPQSVREKLVSPALVQFDLLLLPPPIFVEMERPADWSSWDFSDYQ